MKMKKFNTGYIPFWNIVLFAEAIFRKPENLADESQQVKDVLDQAMRSLFMIGGITSTSTTAVNIYNSLIGLGPLWVVKSLTFLVTIVLLLTIDYSLSVICPFAFDQTFNNNDTPRKKAVASVLCILILFLSVTSINLSYFGVDNTVSYLMDNSPKNASVSVAEAKEDKRSEKLIKRIEVDILAAKKEDDRKFEALKETWDKKIKFAKRKFKTLIRQNNKWAKQQVALVEVGAQEAISNFSPTHLSLVSKKNDLLSKIEDNRSMTISSADKDKKKQEDLSDSRKGNTTFLVSLIGCGSTLLAILVCIALALMKDIKQNVKPKAKRQIIEKQIVTKKSKKVTGGKGEVTGIKLEVTGQESGGLKEGLSVAEIVKKIKQNANHYVERGKIGYHDNIDEYLSMLAKKTDRKLVNGLINDLYVDYNIAGFDIKKYFS